MTVCSHCNPLWPVCHSDSTPPSISIFISLSLSSFFEFPFHPDWSKQMAAFQTRGKLNTKEYRNFKNIFDYLTINWVVRPLRTAFGNANSSNVRQSERVEMGESQRGYLAALHSYSGPSRAASNAPFKFDFGMFPISFCHSSLGN